VLRPQGLLHLHAVHKVAFFSANGSTRGSCSAARWSLAASWCWAGRSAWWLMNH